MVSVFLFQNIFFCLETHYYLCERNLFFCDAKFVVPQACSQITILAAVFIESNTDAIAVKLNLDFFFSEIYLQMCPLLAFPTVFDIIMVPHSKSSSFLLLSTTIYQAH